MDHVIEAANVNAIARLNKYQFQFLFNLHCFLFELTTSINNHLCPILLNCCCKLCIRICIIDSHLGKNSAFLIFANQHNLKSWISWITPLFHRNFTHLSKEMTNYLLTSISFKYSTNTPIFPESELNFSWDSNIEFDVSSKLTILF